MNANHGNATGGYPMASYNVNDGVAPIQGSSSEFQLLLQAISTCAVPLAHQLIQQNPKVVHEKGWHGQTALHRACLIGDQTLCYLLLEAGADPNARNDFEETPLHYACKRGVPTVVHLLIQKGGNLDLVDKNGMSMCHHAAQTGSVYTLVYLYTLRSEYQNVNKQLQLPLHIACHFGHIDAFKFLLKKEKNDINQRDADGNNVLHIAAKEGHQGLCWDILKVGGCELLHEKNNDGNTPADIASQRDKYGHKIIAPIFQYLIRHKPKNYILTDPWWLWTWHLVKPFLFYAATIALARVVSMRIPGYQGYIVIVGVTYLIWTMMYNVHRLDHISRMPNPAFAGSFAAGLVHTTICYLFKVFPTITDEFTWYVISMLVMFSVYYVYYKLLTTDPGRVTHSMIDPETNRPMTIADLCVPQKKMEEFCTVCEIVKPQRTKHCRLCEKCYEDMDHHCLFLLKCVAIKNHTLFVWFLILCVVAMVLFLVNFYLYVVELSFQTPGLIYTIKKLFHDDTWPLSMAIANFFSIIWGINLIRFQLQLVAKGELTAIQKYTKKNQSGLTPIEQFLNVSNFLLGRSPYAKDPVLVAQNL